MCACRKQFSPLAHASTNFTEAYNLTSDAYQVSDSADRSPLRQWNVPNASWCSHAACDTLQVTNLAVGSRLPAGVLAQMSAELWQYANCIGETCP